MAGHKANVMLTSGPISERAHLLDTSIAGPGDWPFKPLPFGEHDTGLVSCCGGTEHLQA